MLCTNFTQKKKEDLIMCNENKTKPCLTLG